MIATLTAKTKFGTLTIGCSERGLRFCQNGRVSREQLPTNKTPVSKKAQQLAKKAMRELKEYSAGKRRSFDIPLDAQGTPFQKLVWRELNRIPFGQTRSYGEIAKACHRPKAARAIGQACNRNPIGIIVPCHRVVGASGALTGYAGGLPTKRKLLDLETK